MCQCISRHNDLLTVISVVLLLIGLVLMAVGYTIPRTYTFNPYTKARDMESTEIYYADLGFALDISITAGMGFIACGGMIMSTVMVYTLICASPENTDQLPLMSNLESQSHHSSYGSTERERSGVSSGRSNTVQLSALR
ncbi:hypothetical protein FSP39_004368 [Pinctada imbricata]|uniref:Uncharacterized protein n=1 Tax=Pinctada imbricata TaxID=66713 RepID=A0AA88XPT2_PINIB|nr:hypothetical protein FSP39_004368 [Pinctada imbricata]